MYLDIPVREKKNIEQTPDEKKKPVYSKVTCLIARVRNYKRSRRTSRRPGMTYIIQNSSCRKAIGKKSFADIINMS